MGVLIEGCAGMMPYRELGATGIRISAVAFGAGPVPALMTGDSVARQRDVLRAALRLGINWFDTAATYGRGCSERSLGQRLAELGARDSVHIATKVRLSPEGLTDIETHVRRSVEGSFQRLGVTRIALLQLHNTITERRGMEHTSVTPHDVLGHGGILETFRRLQDESLVDHLGLTASSGPSRALNEVIDSGHFAALQVPCSVLDFAGGDAISRDAGQETLRDLLARCASLRIGVLAIRVFAGGALVGQPPSVHTRQTRFFPLELYRRDQMRCRSLRRALEGIMDPKEAAVRFMLGRQEIATAIIGFGAPEHVYDLGPFLEAGPLSADVMRVIRSSGVTD